MTVCVTLDRVWKTALKYYIFLKFRRLDSFDSFK